MTINTGFPVRPTPEQIRSIQVHLGEMLHWKIDTMIFPPDQIDTVLQEAECYISFVQNGTKLIVTADDVPFTTIQPIKRGHHA